jgi:hypothetical protein
MPLPPFDVHSIMSEENGHRPVGAQGRVSFVEQPAREQQLGRRAMGLGRFPLHQAGEHGQLVERDHGQPKVEAKHSANVG